MLNRRDFLKWSLAGGAALASARSWAQSQPAERRLRLGEPCPVPRRLTQVPFARAVRRKLAVGRDRRLEPAGPMMRCYSTPPDLR